jgi:multiple sugar transport system substrate-binding protein
MKELNIDLRVVAHPFSEQYEVQYLDLSSGAGLYDVLSFWPIYTADFAPFLEPLKNIQPAGQDAVIKDLVLDDVFPSYKWNNWYKGDVYSITYDGDVKLLHYRHDLATDPKEHEGFKAKYGYDFNIDDLTWDQYLDVARWFQRPEQNFFGDAEIAGFLAGWAFRDRFVGMGGHYFDPDTMKAFPKPEICLKAAQNILDIVATGSPPEAKSFEFEDARNQIIVHNRVMFVPQWPDVWKWANDSKLSKAVGKVWVAEMPGFKDASGKVVHRPEMNGGRVLAVNKASRVKEAAYKVLVFFGNPAITKQLVYNNDTWLDPWRLSHVADVSLLKHLGIDDAGRQNYIDVLKKSTQDAYPGLQIPGVGKYYEVQERWAKKLFAGQVTAADACSNLASEFEAITDQIGREKQKKEYQAYVDTVLKPLNLYP